MTSVILKPGREESLRRRHPWVFSGAVESVRGEPEPGGTVDILASDGAWLARGAFSPRSQITVRVWSFAVEEEVEAGFFGRRLEQALKARKPLLERADLTACRLVSAESDGLPGLIVDRYADFLVCQFLSWGAERWRGEIVSRLRERLGLEDVYERSDEQVREKEGLQPRAGVLSGRMPPERLEIREGPAHFRVDIRGGHKTGFYLDQRENRELFRGFAAGAEVLNGFAYTGGFGVWALLGGAGSLTQVESSAQALELGRENLALNGFGDRGVEDLCGDVFQVLRRFRDAGRRFDLIVLDPPKFARSAGQVERAARGYKDINLLAFKLLGPEGVLFTFSCSAHVQPALFQKIVADAALDAGREAQIIRDLGQAADHPVALHFPESRYLKGLVCRAW